MISTKKHLSRRTFLRGAGVAVGLPFLDAMVPAWTALAQTAAAPKPRMGFMYLPHGAIMEHWTPEAVGTNFELPADPEAAGAVPEAAHGGERPGEQAHDRAAGARAEPGHVAQLRDAARHGRSLRRRHGGPDCGRAHRPGHPAPVDRGRDRGPRRQRRLRPRCTAAPTATRSRSARPRRRCRWKRIRGSCSSGCSARATRRPNARPSRGSTRASSTWCRRRPRTCARSLDGPDKARLGRLPGERARDRAPRPEDGGAGLLGPGPARGAGDHQLRPAPEPDVRHDRAGVSGQPDARVLAS